MGGKTKMESRPGRVIVIRESLVDITGSTNEAKILNQFLYWTKNTYSFAEQIKEEKKRLEREGDTEKRIDIDVEELKAGWIYKSIDNLYDELLGDISRDTIAKCIKNLISKGFLFRRRNPRLKWDRTYQYRVDLVKISESLQQKGWTIEEFKIPTFNKKQTCISEKSEFNSGKVGVQNQDFPEAIPEINNIDYIKENNTYIVENEKNKNQEAIPYKEIVEYLNEKAGKQYRDTTPKTRELIKARWNEGFRLEDFKKVIDNKTLLWKGTEMETYLRPVTLFSTKFESYLNEDPSVIKRIKPKENYNIKEFFDGLDYDYIVEINGNEYLAKKRFNEYAEKYGVDKDARALFKDFVAWCKKLVDEEKKSIPRKPDQPPNVTLGTPW